MEENTRHAHFSGNVVMIGFGSIGQAILPLLMRHLQIHPEQIRIISAHGGHEEAAQAFGIHAEIIEITPENYVAKLRPSLKPGDFLLNLSVNVSSLALIELCHQCQALYIDTCIEPWAGGYDDTSKTPSERSNYALREQALKLRRRHGKGATAVITQGANPGLISAFAKQALLNIAQDNGLNVGKPATKEGWATLARQLGIKAIHVAERDTQMASHRKQHGEFVNTWSIDGFVGEGMQPAELGWGSHEKHLPPEGRKHGFGCDAAIYLDRPGISTRVRSWTPSEGPFHGFLITHSESVSLADYLTLRENGEVVYRPTVHYAYHPCDDAVLSIHEIVGKNLRLQANKRIIRDEIVSGMDELGVLLMGNEKGVYWYGSRLSIDEARQLAPHNSATTLQVAAGVLAGMVWAIRHPNEGIVEPEEIDDAFILAIARPYLGEVAGTYGDWTPLQDRGVLFDEDIDTDDPWQFGNILVR